MKISNYIHIYTSNQHEWPYNSIHDVTPTQKFLELRMNSALQNTEPRTSTKITEGG